MADGFGNSFTGLRDDGCVSRHDGTAGVGGGVYARKDDPVAATRGTPETLDRGVDVAPRDFSCFGGSESENGDAFVVSRGDCAFSFESEFGYYRGCCHDR